MNSGKRPLGLFDLRAVAQACALGLETGADGEARVDSLCLDSRQAGPGSIFVALAGERCDGHDFILGAFKAGCRVALVSRQAYAQRQGLLGDLYRSGMSFLVAEDSLGGLQALAAWYLSLFPRLKRVGITGSSGKTSTKEMLVAIASRGRHVVANEGNLNSETGLPLSVFRVRAEHELGIFELGMNHKGEMAGLARVLSPDLALIVNVGTAHIGILGSQEAIALEKKAIFSRFDGAQLGLIPEDCQFEGLLRQGVPGRITTFGRRSTPGFRGAVSLGLDGSAIDWEGSRIRLALPGRHNVENALAAISLALELGIAAADIVAGLEAVRPGFGRGQILRGPVCVLQDCYNANAESLAAALDFADEVEWPNGRKVYLIGSMRELGEQAQAIHSAAGRRLAGSQARAVFLFGPETADAASSLEAGGFTGVMERSEDFDSVRERLLAYLKPGDLVLVKGSRSMEMERFTQAIQGRFGGEGQC